MASFETTDIFDKNEFNKEYIRLILTDVIIEIEKKGYDPVNQIMGYLKTENPIYIPRDNNAREKIKKIEKDEILEYLVHFFVEENKC